MPEFRPFRCLVVPFIAAARLPVGAKAAPSLPQGIKQADAKCLKLKDLDAKMGGLQPSDLIIIAGRPAMGKSSLATNIAALPAYVP